MRFPKDVVRLGDLASTPKLGEAAFRLLIALAVLADRDGVVRGYSQSDLASHAGVSRATAREAMDRLQSAGAVEFDPSQGRRTEYRVTSRWVPNLAGRPAKLASDANTNLAGGPAKLTPNLAGGPAKLIPAPYRGPSRAHVQEVAPTSNNHLTNATATNNTPTHDTTAPPVLGGSGVATPENTTTHHRDNITYLPRPVATAPDNNKRDVS